MILPWPVGVRGAKPIAIRNRREGSGGRLPAFRSATRPHDSITKNILGITQY
jgi:hypothetical protein